MGLPIKPGQMIVVSVRNDHLETLARPSKCLSGIAELVWNALDAEADNVRVALVENDIDGLNSVIVKDDGHGMTPEDAIRDFSFLGGSWKLRAVRSKNQQRLLHGRHGQGRWRAFSVGSLVTWTTIADTDEGRFRTVVSGAGSSLTEFMLSPPEPTNEDVGTTVTIQNIHPDALGPLRSEKAASRLTASLAPYFEQCPTVSVYYAGESLDPRPLEDHKAEYEVPLDDDSFGPMRLVVIEWKKHFDREIFLCDENGLALHACPAGIQAPSFDFTAYLRWRGFREHEPDLVAEDMNPVVAGAVEAGRAALREHFKMRGAELQTGAIQQWKDEGVYPYEGEVVTPLDQAERDLFDIVAPTAARAVNASSDRAGRRLSLRLMRAAIGQSPTALGRVLREVLGLSPERIEELDRLLERTSLSSIISLGRLVADRLDFLAGLEEILFEPEAKKAVLERRHLHRILETEAWVFGDEYALAASDKGLTKVLAEHISYLGRDHLAEDDDPVTMGDGLTGIVDLMFSRSLPIRAKEREHLVVELKRPSLRLSNKELSQIEQYAHAVAKNPRFDKLNVKWNFWLVGVSMDDFLEDKTAQPHLEAGVATQLLDGRVTVRAKTWAQIIEDCQARLKLVREMLEMESAEDLGLQYLREHYADRLPRLLAPDAVAAS